LSKITICWRHHILAANITSNLGRAVSAPHCAAFNITSSLHSLAQSSSSRINLQSSKRAIRQAVKCIFRSDTRAPSPSSRLQLPASCTPPGFGIPANTFLGLFPGCFAERSLDAPKGCNQARELFTSTFAQGRAKAKAKARARHSQGTTKAILLPSSSLGTTALLYPLEPS
jgi:hypothetical protein